MKNEIWGVLGGMGPLASAEFVKSIYEENLWAVEQESPIVLLLSNPRIPDRTSELLKGRETPLIQCLHSGVNQLLAMGATKIVICCLTMHRLLHHLTPEQRSKVISLIDVTLTSVLERRGRYLLICTNGTRRLGLFQQHELWDSAKSRIQLPDEKDQSRLHHLIYEVKSRNRDGRHIEFLESLMQKYAADAYIAGCTEMHILAKEHGQIRGCNRQEFCLDPLTVIASMIASSSAIPSVC